MSDQQRERDGNSRGEEATRERTAASEGLVDDQDSPLKRHGDALADGSGNRHGVHQADREPDPGA